MIPEKQSPLSQAVLSMVSTSFSPLLIIVWEVVAGAFQYPSFIFSHYKHFWAHCHSLPSGSSVTGASEKSSKYLLHHPILLLPPRNTFPWPLWQPSWLICPYPSFSGSMDSKSICFIKYSNLAHIKIHHLIISLYIAESVASTPIFSTRVYCSFIH